MVISNFRVLQVNVTDTVLIWSAIGNVAKFNVYYRETSSTPWVLLTPDGISDLRFTHRNPNYDKFQRGHYKLEAVLISGVTESREVDLFSKATVYDNRLIRAELFDLMSNVNSLVMPAVAYQRRLSGDPCPRCGPDVSIGALQGKCPVCFGTSWIGGFYCPILLYLSFSEIIRNETSHPGDRFIQESMNQIRTSAGFGFLKVGDYIREILPPNRLWAVASEAHSESNNRPLSYLLGVKQEESNHPLYLRVLPEITLPTYVTYLNVFEELNNANTRLSRQD